MRGLDITSIGTFIMDNTTTLFKYALKSDINQVFISAYITNAIGIPYDVLLEMSPVDIQTNTITGHKVYVRLSDIYLETDNKEALCIEQ